GEDRQDDALEHALEHLGELTCHASSLLLSDADYRYIVTLSTESARWGSGSADPSKCCPRHAQAWAASGARDHVFQCDPREHGALDARRVLGNAAQGGGVAEPLLVQRDGAAGAQGLAEFGDPLAGGGHR